MPLIEECISLAKAMKQDARYLRLLELEKKMERDPDCLDLSKQFKQIQDRLNEPGLEQKTTANLLKELSSLKEKLYTQPSAAEYLKALNQWNDLSREISGLVFGGLYSR